MAATKELGAGQPHPKERGGNGDGDPSSLRFAETFGGGDAETQPNLCRNLRRQLGRHFRMLSRGGLR